MHENTERQADVVLSRDEYGPALFESFDCVYVHDLEGRFLDANSAALELLGYERDEILALDFSSLLDQDHQAKALGLLADMRESWGREAPVEFRLRRKTGDYVDVEVKGRIVSRDGQPCGVLGVARDVTEQRQKERELRDSEQRYRSLTESLPNGIIVHQGGRIVFVNPAAARIGGASAPADLVGRNVMEFVHPDSLETARQNIEKAYRTGEPSDAAEERFFRLDGSVVDVEVVAIPMTLEGKPAINTVIQDITPRRQAEEMLRLHSQIVTNMQEAVYLVRAEDGVIAYTNPAFTKIFGYAEGEMIGQPVSVLNAPGEKSPEETAAEIMGALEKRGTWSGEVDNIRKDGTRFTCAAEVSTFDHHELGAVLLSVHTDITERKQVEQALLASEAELKRAQSLAHVGSWSRAIGDEHSRWSEELYRILGLEPGLPAPGNVDEGGPLAPEDWARVSRGMEEALTTGEPYEVEMRVTRSDGDVRWIVEAGAPTIGESGRVTGLHGTVQDITERKVAEQALRESRERTQAAQRLESVGLLAGGIAHDFNNLLTAIIGYAELGQARSTGDPIVDEAFGEIRASADRAAALTHQLLAFSRKQPLQPRVVDLNAVTESTAGLLHRLIGEDAELTLQFQLGLWPVEVDPGQVEQAIVNLVLNARDAMPHGGKLTIETANVELGEEYTDAHPQSRPGPHVMLAVSDTGTGMDPDTVGRIFEPFFTTKEQGKGTGLGLSTVYGIVKQSGGNIYVYSEPGQGTVVKVFLPRADTPINWTPEGMSFPRGRVEGGGETVLVVEDEPALLTLAVRILVRAGYTVLHEGTPAKALKLYEEHRGAVDLLLTDVVLPGMSGKVLAETIQARQGVSPRVLFMSGYTQNAIMHDGRLDQGVNFLEKPFTPAVLLRTVREVLDRPHEGQLGLPI